MLLISVKNPVDNTEKTPCGRVGEMGAIIHQCCLLLIAFASGHYHNIQQKVCHLMAFSAFVLSYLLVHWPKIHCILLIVVSAC